MGVFKFVDRFQGSLSKAVAGDSGDREQLRELLEERDRALEDYLSGKQMLVATGSGVATATLTPTTTSAQTVTGTSVTVAAGAGDVIEVIGFFDMYSATAGAVLVGELDYNGFKANQQAIFVAAAANDRKSVGASWFLYPTERTEYALSLTARHVGASTGEARITHTYLRYKVFR